MQNRIYGNLVIENEEHVVKGDLEIIGGTLIMTNANLVVEGNLTIRHGSKGFTVDASSIVNGSIYAKSISISSSIVIKNGNITTFADLNCGNIYSENGDINVGGNSDVCNVYCKNYLVDGNNDSFNIEADNIVCILGLSDNFNISAPEVFIGDDSDFNLSIITANYFESTGHIYNCICRKKFVAN